MYELIAKDANGKVVMKDRCEGKMEAYFGYDIWCDISLDETGTITYVELLDLTTNEKVFSSKVR